jgi:hypothetical protein
MWIVQVFDSRGCTYVAGAYAILTVAEARAEKLRKRWTRTEVVNLAQWEPDIPLRVYLPTRRHGET